MVPGQKANSKNVGILFFDFLLCVMHKVRKMSLYRNASAESVMGLLCSSIHI